MHEGDWKLRWKIMLDPYAKLIVGRDVRGEVRGERYE
jgi:hypothetical protein